jgi:hypothetical protein
MEYAYQQLIKIQLKHFSENFSNSNTTTTSTIDGSEDSDHSKNLERRQSRTKLKRSNSFGESSSKSNQPSPSSTILTNSAPASNLANVPADWRKSKHYTLRPTTLFQMMGENSKSIDSLTQEPSSNK